MTMPSQSGAGASGLSFSAVQIALACTSGPAMSSCDIGVAWRSCRLGAEAPTTTILPRTSAGSNLPFSTSMNDRVGKDSGVPW